MEYVLEKGVDNMCNKADNSCRQEKLGCKGCLYENLKYNDLINTLINTDFLEGACSEETANEYKKAIKYLLNIIEKQAKEIEELKAIKSMQDYRIQVIDEREFISKDKIKEKIKEIDNFPSSTNEERDEHLYAMEVLNELLKYFK